MSQRMALVIAEIWREVLIGWTEAEESSNRANKVNKANMANIANIAGKWRGVEWIVRTPMKEQNRAYLVCNSYTQPPIDIEI